MAEFVQESLEEMLPELRFMSQSSLFTSEETEEILRRRTQFEYRLVRRHKEKADFIQYIQYEVNLLALWNLRLKKFGISVVKMSKQFLAAISTRINRLFSRIIQRFSNDLKVWMSYIQFCQHLGWDSKATEIFFGALKHHGKNENLWIMAARWEIESRMDFAAARTLLHRALKFHPKSKIIWLECFWLELAHTVEARNRRIILSQTLPDVEESVKDEQKLLKAAEIVFKNVLSTFPDEPLFWLSFANEILKLECDGIDFTKLINYIIQCTEKYNDVPHINAKLIRFKFQIIQSKGDVDDLSVLKELDLMVERNPDCTDTRMEFADLCVYLLSEITNSDLYSELSQRLVSFIKWLTSCHVPINIPEKLLISLIDFCVNNKNNEDAKNLILWGFTHLKNQDLCSSSFPLWKRSISLNIILGVPVENTNFKELMGSFMTDDEVMELWGIIMSALISKGDTNKALELVESYVFNSRHKRNLPLYESFLRLKISNCPTINDFFQKDYSRLSAKFPHSYEFYKAVVDVLLEFEACGRDVPWSLISRVLEDSVTNTGNKEPNAWLLYIELDGRMNEYRRSSELNWRALKCLDKDKVTVFVESLTKFKSCEGVIL